MCNHRYRTRATHILVSISTTTGCLDSGARRFDVEEIVFCSNPSCELVFMLNGNKYGESK